MTIHSFGEPGNASGGKEVVRVLAESLISAERITKIGRKESDMLFNNIIGRAIHKGGIRQVVDCLGHTWRNEAEDGRVLVIRPVNDAGSSHKVQWRGGVIGSGTEAEVILSSSGLMICVTDDDTKSISNFVVDRHKRRQGLIKGRVDGFLDGVVD